jgi:hypothetical protein
MRGLLALVVGMGVLIVAGVAVIGVTIVHRMTAPPPMRTEAASAMLDQPAGTQIVSVAGLGDRLAVTLRGGGPDRVVILDAASLRPLGQVALAR